MSIKSQPKTVLSVPTFESEMSHTSFHSSPSFGINLYEKANDESPRTYFIFSLFTTACCNVLFGLVAIIYSMDSRDAYRAGRILESRRYARRSLLFNIASIVLCFVTILIFFGFFIRIHYF